MIKLFATDLDGTLLAKNHRADEKINAMVHKVIDEGKYFTLATGRNAKSARPDEIDCPVYLICMNGAMIQDVDGSILYQDTLHKDVLKQLMDEFEDLDFDFIGPEKTYKRTSKEQWLEEHKKPFRPKHMDSNDPIDENWHKIFMQDMFENTEFSQTKEDILNKEICKVNLHMRGKNMDTSKLDAFLKKHENEIVNAPCDRGMYEITNKGTDKGSAVAWLAKYLNVKEDEVATYGDGGNDIPMLTRFQHSYSPCNGLDYVIGKASNVIGPHYEHSVTNHILNTLKES